MNEQPTPQAIAQQMEHIHNELGIAKDQLTILVGMATQLEARINGLVAEMREWRQSRSDTNEPHHGH
jgi:uracil-DNA glycosylase